MSAGSIPSMSSYRDGSKGFMSGGLLNRGGALSADEFGPVAEPVFGAQIPAPHAVAGYALNVNASVNRHAPGFPVRDCLLAYREMLNDCGTHGWAIKWMNLVHEPDHTLYVYRVNYLFLPEETMPV